VFLVFLLLFGSDKIPELAKGLGKGLREFKKATDDIKREINTSTGDITRDITESTRGIRQNIADITSDITDDINRNTGEINRNLNETLAAEPPSGTQVTPEDNTGKTDTAQNSTEDVHQHISEITDNIGS